MRTGYGRDERPYNLPGESMSDVREPTEPAKPSPLNYATPTPRQTAHTNPVVGCLGAVCYGLLAAFFLLFAASLINEAPAVGLCSFAVVIVTSWRGLAAFAGFRRWFLGEDRLD